MKTKMQKYFSSYYSLNNLQFGDEIKQLKFEKENPKRSKILQFSRFFLEGKFLPDKGQKGQKKEQNSIGLQCKALNIATFEAWCVWIILAKKTQEISTRSQQTCKKFFSAEYLEPRHTKRFAIN